MLFAIFSIVIPFQKVFQLKLELVIIGRILESEHARRLMPPGYYDYNVLDQNGVVGYHPAFQNFFIAAGFSGHGIQMSPGIGRAAADIIVDNHKEDRLFDLQRFSFERFYSGDLIFEQNVV